MRDVEDVSCRRDGALTVGSKNKTLPSLNPPINFFFVKKRKKVSRDGAHTLLYKDLGTEEGWRDGSGHDAYLVAGRQMVGCGGKGEAHRVVARWEVFSPEHLLPRLGRTDGEGWNVRTSCGRAFFNQKLIG